MREHMYKDHFPVRAIFSFLILVVAALFFVSAITSHIGTSAMIGVIALIVGAAGGLITAIWFELD